MVCPAANRRKRLSHATGRPHDVEPFDTGGRTQPDPLRVWRRAKRAAAGDDAMALGQGSVGLTHKRGEAGADAGPIALAADQAHADRAIRGSRIPEQRLPVRVAGHEPAHVGQQIVVAVAVHVAKGHAVPLLQVAGAAGRGGITEPAAAVVAQQHVRDQRRVGRRARADVDVEKAVVVDVAEVRAHRRHDPRQAAGRS